MSSTRLPGIAAPTKLVPRAVARDKPAPAARQRVSVPASSGSEASANDPLFPTSASPPMEEWTRKMWYGLGMAVKRCGPDLTIEEKHDVVAFVMAHRTVTPCTNCRAHLIAYTQQHPFDVDTASSSERAMEWLVQYHASTKVQGARNNNSEGDHGEVGALHNVPQDGEEERDHSWLPALLVAAERGAEDEPLLQLPRAGSAVEPAPGPISKAPRTQTYAPTSGAVVLKALAAGAPLPGSDASASSSNNPRGNFRGAASGGAVVMTGGGAGSSVLPRAKVTLQGLSRQATAAGTRLDAKARPRNGFLRAAAAAPTVGAGTAGSSSSAAVPRRAAGCGCGR